MFVGDVVHNALDASTNYTWFLHHRNALTVASDLFKRFSLPVHFMWGASLTCLITSRFMSYKSLHRHNPLLQVHTTALDVPVGHKYVSPSFHEKRFTTGNHDYKTVCGDTAVSVARDVNHRLFRTFFDAPPYQAVAVGPWRLLLLNSMLGATWDPLHAQCKPMCVLQLVLLLCTCSCVDACDADGGCCMSLVSAHAPFACTCLCTYCPADVIYLCTYCPADVIYLCTYCPVDVIYLCTYCPVGVITCAILRFCRVPFCIFVVCHWALCCTHQVTARQCRHHLMCTAWRAMERSSLHGWMPS